MIRAWKVSNVTVIPNIVTQFTPTTDCNVFYIINRVATGAGNIYADDPTNPNVSSNKYSLVVNQGTTGSIVRPYKLNQLYITTDALSSFTIQVIEIVSDDLSFVFNTSQLVQISGIVTVSGSVEIANDSGNPIPVTGSITSAGAGNTSADAQPTITTAVQAQNFNFGFNGTTWDRLRTVAVGDAYAGTGLLANGLYGFNGTTWDRVMTSNSGQLRVSLFSTAGVAAPVTTFGSADNNSVNTNLLGVGAFNLLYDGTNWTRQRAATGIGDGTNNGSIASVALTAYNGTNWDRVRSVNTGQLKTTLYNSSGTELGIFTLSTGIADGSALSVGALVSAAVAYASNGTTFDRLRTAQGLGATTTTLTGAPASVMYGWNGTGSQIERIKTVADGLTGTLNGILKVSLYDSGGNHYNNANLGAIGDGQAFTAQGYGNVQGAVQYGYIGSGGFDRVRVSKVYKTREYNTLTNGSAADVWTPATNKSFRLMGVSLSASVAGKYTLRDGATNVILYFSLIANDTIYFYLGNGLLSAASNNILYIVNNSGSTANVWCNAWGVEE